jgi:hypothetical protein
MALVRLSHEIRAPVEAVFDFADNHENYPGFFQGFTKFEWTTPRHQTGTRLKMESKLAGIEFPIEVETVGVVPDRRISGTFVSGLRGHFDWDFETTGETTWVTLTAEYELPAWFLAQTGGRFPVDHDLCLHMERTLAALKEMVETPAAQRR